MAGMRILLAGGNAFDAMVAASLAAAVVEPIASYSLAAEGVFMLYDSGSGDLLSLSGQGGAPGSATAEFYRSRGHERIPTGPRNGRPAVLHPTGNCGRVHQHAGTVRDDVFQGGGGASHPLCRGRDTALRIHAGEAALPYWPGAVR